MLEYAVMRLREFRVNVRQARNEASRPTTPRADFCIPANRADTAAWPCHPKPGIAFSHYFEIVPALTDALKDHVYAIRHQVYCEDLAYEPQRPIAASHDATTPARCMC